MLMRVGFFFVILRFFMAKLCSLARSALAFSLMGPSFPAITASKMSPVGVPDLSFFLSSCAHVCKHSIMLAENASSRDGVAAAPCVTNFTIVVEVRRFIYLTIKQFRCAGSMAKRSVSRTSIVVGRRLQYSHKRTKFAGSQMSAIYSQKK
jgi:hypothetical protein